LVVAADQAAFVHRDDEAYGTNGSSAAPASLAGAGPA
jgi:hypothetical protein